MQGVLSMLDILKNLTDVNEVNLNRDERMISLVGGSILMIYALIRIPITAVLAALAASYLFFRGMRGFCYINDRLGLNKAVDIPAMAEVQDHKNNQLKAVSH
jgi:uncharacterized membrane protein